MTNTQFVKLVRTCPGLSHLQVTDLDIIFARMKSKGERTISFDQVGKIAQGREGRDEKEAKVSQPQGTCKHVARTWAPLLTLPQLCPSLAVC